MKPATRGGGGATNYRGILKGNPSLELGGGGGAAHPLTSDAYDYYFYLLIIVIY